VTGNIYVGTSGFAYKEWKGPFYPEELKDQDMLGFYAGRFPAVEINYTFRRQPATKTIDAWTERTPPAFRFALKAHQRITHTRRLREADSAVSEFLDRVRSLGDRLGPILFQCPPTLQFDRSLIESFVGYLPPTFRYAMEFRHESWAQARELLAEQGVAWCVAETDETTGARDAFTAEPFGYLRLRKEEYSEEELASWAETIGKAAAGDRDVYCFLKHEEKGAGPRFAEALSRLLG
jgi:uncharacterized protein YecE (DUF72 family)